MTGNFSPINREEPLGGPTEGASAGGEETRRPELLSREPASSWAGPDAGSWVGGDCACSGRVQGPMTKASKRTWAGA